MGFLLLGIDSLIACIAVGPIISRRWSVPFAALFGICDGGGFLLGSALHWQVPGNVSTVLTTAILVALGIYWIAIAIFARTTQVFSSRSLVWALPFATILMGLVYLPGSFLPILALTARLFWRIRRAAEAFYAPETTSKFVQPALQP